MPRTRFDSDRSWDFELTPDVLWARFSSVADYSTWWPWLERFQPVGGFQAGARWACTVSPPLPYLVRFSVLLDEVRPPDRRTLGWSVTSRATRP